MPPEKFNKLLEFLELKNIFVTDLKSSLNLKIASKKLQNNPVLNFSEDSKIIELNDDSATLEVSYKLNAKVKTSKLFDITLKYAVLFEQAQKLPEEFYETYQKLSLPLQTFPYFREYTNSIISRMGLPALILPLRKYLVGKQ